MLKDAELDIFKKVMDINYFGTVYCTKLALESIICPKRHHSRRFIDRRLQGPAGPEWIFGQQIRRQWLAGSYPYRIDG